MGARPEVHHCDRCGKVIDLKRDHGIATVQRKFPSVKKGWSLRDRKWYDKPYIKTEAAIPQKKLCAECVQGMADAIENYCKEV